MDTGAVVVTFARTVDAFAYEDAARAAQFPGRLIPLPTGIAATCGLAWLLGPADADPRPFLADRGLHHEEVYRHGDDRSYHRLDR